MLKRKQQYNSDKYKIRFYNYDTGEYIGTIVYNRIPQTGEYIQYKNDQVSVMQVTNYTNGYVLHIKIGEQNDKTNII